MYSSPVAPTDSSVAAIRCLAERGYEATTAEHLANALGVSRSTFFRRFGNKDDVVFADHDLALAQLERHLDASEGPIAKTLSDATSAVLRLLIRDPEAARMRFELMRVTPALRDRELVITHRYERVFANYLRRALPDGTPKWVSASLASGAVAVHNTVLRDWLTDAIDDAPGVLERNLRELSALYLRWLAPETDDARSRVVVAVFDAQGSTDAVLQAVSRQINEYR